MVKPILIILVFAAVVAGLSVVQYRSGHGPGTFSAAGPRPDFPSPGHEESKKPLGAPARNTPRSTTFRILNPQLEGDDPIAWDPCRPIHYVTRRKDAPTDSAQIVASAVTQLSRATGLRFVNDGATTESYSRRRSSYQRTRYGDRWAPVLITWETQSENPDFATGVIGEASPYPAGLGDHPLVYVTGTLQFDATKLGRLMKTAPGRRTARAVVLHEFGHLAGLDHVTDPAQVMFPETRVTALTYGAGDLAGLARLGRGPCAPWL